MVLLFMHITDLAATFPESVSTVCIQDIDPLADKLQTLAPWYALILSQPQLQTNLHKSAAFKCIYCT